MKRLVVCILSVFIISNVLKAQEHSVKFGIGQDVGNLGGAYEFKYDKFAACLGIGAYSPGSGLIGWELSALYYPFEQIGGFNNSPYLQLGYGVYGGQWDNGVMDTPSKVLYAMYSMAGYRWWFNKLSLQIGIGVGKNLTLGGDLDSVFSLTLGYQLF